MTPSEFKAARHSLGLSTRALGHILGVDQRTIRRWEAGETVQHRPPHPTACRAMNWMLDGYRPPEWTR